MAEICLAAIMVLMPVNQVDTAFEYAVILFAGYFLGSVNRILSALLFDYAFKHSY